MICLTSVAPLAAVAAGTRSPLTAVVDIGSNSVRMVVYLDGGRAPVPVFNERTLCGLGRRLSTTHRLDPQGVKSALQHLRRFGRLGRSMGVESWHVLATEAVRSADDGPDFVDDVADIMRAPVEILTGAAEAETSAMGVISGTPDADGMMGDLGGGSLEIVTLDRGQTGRRATLPLGALRLKADFNDDIAAAERFVGGVFNDVDWLPEVRGRTFYPVGGAWRAFANVHMGHTGYPLHVIHGYHLSRRDALDTLRLVSRLSQRSLGRIPGVPKARLATLHLAAVVLGVLLTRAQPSDVVFSAYGLREGWLYRNLTREQRALDPLVEGAAELAARDPRVGTSGETLAAWTAPLFADAPPARQRLREAAAHLADINWRDHPDYRAEDAFWKVLHLPLPGLDHAERAMLAFAISARYGGGPRDGHKDAIAPLIDAEALDFAILLGRALRLALTISGGTNDILEKSSLKLTRKTLTVNLPPGDGYLVSDVARRRLTSLAKRIGRAPRVKA